MAKGELRFITYEEKGGKPVDNDYIQWSPNQRGIQTKRIRHDEDEKLDKETGKVVVDENGIVVMKEPHWHWLAGSDKMSAETIYKNLEQLGVKLLPLEQAIIKD